MRKMQLLILVLLLNFSFVYSGANFVLMGPPGAGKGSFAQLMQQEYGYVSICVGDRLKEHVRNETEIGLQIKPIIERGDFVATEIGNNILREDLRSCLDSGNQFIIDGFVRNGQYFRYLDEILQEFDCADDVIFLVFSHNEEISLKRILGRILCDECGEIYNTYTRKPQSSMTCDQCGHTLDKRIDDLDEAVVQRRFNRYLTESLPVLEEIEPKYKIIKIDSTKDWAELKELYLKLGEDSHPCASVHKIAQAAKRPPVKR